MIVVAWAEKRWPAFFKMLVSLNPDFVSASQLIEDYTFEVDRCFLESADPG